jgi:hypothetical protein
VQGGVDLTNECLEIILNVAEPGGLATRDLRRKESDLLLPRVPFRERPHAAKANAFASSAFEQGIPGIPPNLEFIVNKLCVLLMSYRNHAVLRSAAALVAMNSFALILVGISFRHKASVTLRGHLLATTSSVRRQYCQESAFDSRAFLRHRQAEMRHASQLTFR